MARRRKQSSRYTKTEKQPRTYLTYSKANRKENAVQEYEIYLKEIRDKLLKAFLEQCGDRIRAENLTRQIFDEMDLPYLTSD